MDKEKCLKLIDEFEQFEDNWDYDGAPVFNKEDLNYARCFIKKMRIDIPQPFICPIAGGIIQIEWDINNRHLEMEITEDEITKTKEICWLKDDGKKTKTSSLKGEYEYGTIDCEDTEKINGLIDWVLGNKGDLTND